MIFVKEKENMIVLVTRNLKIKTKRVVAVSKRRDHLDFLLSLLHILMFYTLLLASMTWYEKYASWVMQLTSWVLCCNCYFYTALFYVNNAKSLYLMLKKETIRRILSEIFTVTYILNLSVTYYFLLAVYPRLKGSDAHRLLGIYLYPGLSVMINLIIDFNYTKPLHFRRFSSSVITVSLFIAIISILRHLFNGLKLTEAELGRAAWFDPINLREKFQIFLIIMLVNYLGLKFIFRMVVFKNHCKRRLRARKVSPKIHP